MLKAIWKATYFTNINLFRNTYRRLSFITCMPLSILNVASLMSYNKAENRLDRASIRRVLMKFVCCSCFIYSRSRESWNLIFILPEDVLHMTLLFLCNFALYICAHPLLQRADLFVIYHVPRLSQIAASLQNLIISHGTKSSFCFRTFKFCISELAYRNYRVPLKCVVF